MNRTITSSPIRVDNDSTDPVIVKVQKPDGPDHVYINIQVAGDNTTDPTCPHKKFRYRQNFNQPILSHMENYYLSVVTLTFPAVEVPLTIINNIQTGATQSNPNLTDWSFCFTYNGNDYQEFIQYIPFNNFSVAAPSQNPPNFTQVNSSYYFIDNYNVLLEMMNTTLSNIYAAMWAAESVSLGALGLTVTDEPQFIYDEQQQKFILVYNKLFIGNGIQLFTSDTWSVYFPGFWTRYYGTSTINFKDYEFIFATLLNNEYDTDNNSNSQQYDGSGSYLNTINQVILTSNSLRTRFEFTTSDSSTELAFSNVIFSLTPLLETAKESKSKLVYVANGIYRLVDIISNGTIRELDISVFYTDNKGNVYDICIPKNFSASMKLLFMKKSVVNDV